MANLNYTAAEINQLLADQDNSVPEIIEAAQDQSVFSGITKTVTSGKVIIVHKMNVLYETDDYTVDSDHQITLNFACNAGEKLMII